MQTTQQLHTQEPDDDEDALDPEIAVSRQAIGTLLRRKRDSNALVLKSSRSRNIVFLGRTRSGKTRAITTLRDPYKFAEAVSLYSETPSATRQNFTIIDRNSSEDNPINYSISVIDTPGLFERRNDDIGTRDNADIEELISDCLGLEMSKVHAVFFVCSVESGINQQDIEAILALQNSLQGAETIFHLLVTRCEGRNVHGRARIEAEYRMEKQLQPFFAQPGTRVFFIGALSDEDYDMGAVNAVETKIDNILAMRTILYRFLFDEATVPCYTSQFGPNRRFRNGLTQFAERVEETGAQLAGASSPVDKAKFKSILRVSAKALRLFSEARVLSSEERECMRTKAQKALLDAKVEIKPQPFVLYYATAAIAIAVLSSIVTLFIAL